MVQNFKTHSLVDLPPVLDFELGLQVVDNEGVPK